MCSTESRTDFGRIVSVVFGYASCLDERVKQGAFDCAHFLDSWLTLASQILIAPSKELVTYYCIPLYPAPLNPISSAQALLGKRGTFGSSLFCRSASSVLVPRLRSFGSPRPLLDLDFPPRCDGFGTPVELSGVLSAGCSFGVLQPISVSNFTRFAPKRSVSISEGRLTIALGEVGASGCTSIV